MIVDSEHTEHAQGRSNWHVVADLGYVPVLVEINGRESQMFVFFS